MPGTPRRHRGFPGHIQGIVSGFRVRVEGLGFRVKTVRFGLRGSGICSLGLQVWGLGKIFGIWVAAFMAWSLGFRAFSGFRIWGLGVLGFGIWGCFRVLGFGFGASGCA